MNKGTIDIIDQESYNCGYIAGAIESYAKCRNQFTRNVEREYRRMLYFLKQKLYGVLTILITFLLITLLDGDATIAVFTLPLAFMLIFGKHMILVNDFYWEEKRRMRGRR